MGWTIENWPLLATAAGQHLALVGQALAIALAASLVLGIASARRPALYGAVIGVTGALYTIPSLALLAMLIPLFGLGQAPAVTALVLFSLLILTRNIATGLREVPAETLEAADGMGFGRAARLWRIELPLALPAIVSGIRLAVVTQIAVATIAAYVGAGGLGMIVFAGIEQDFPEKIAAGALAAAAMALAADWGLRRIERAMRARIAP
ncbi:MAG: ABC transporter permease [Alphaproteobacteria bacterium]|nr:ABC transporter permease [Alphaproteobacteria bacterium]